MTPRDSPLLLQDLRQANGPYFSSSNGNRAEGPIRHSSWRQLRRILRPNRTVGRMTQRLLTHLIRHPGDLVMASTSHRRGDRSRMRLNTQFAEPRCTISTANRPQWPGLASSPYGGERVAERHGKVPRAEGPLPLAPAEGSLIGTFDPDDEMPWTPTRGSHGANRDR